MKELRVPKNTWINVWEKTYTWVNIIHENVKCLWKTQFSRFSKGKYKSYKITYYIFLIKFFTRCIFLFSGHHTIFWPENCFNDFPSAVFLYFLLVFLIIKKAKSWKMISRTHQLHPSNRYPSQSLRSENIFYPKSCTHN